MIPDTMRTLTAVRAVARLILDPQTPKERDARALAELALQVLGHKPSSKYDSHLRACIEACQRAIRERAK